MNLAHFVLKGYVIICHFPHIYVSNVDFRTISFALFMPASSYSLIYSGAYNPLVSDATKTKLRYTLAYTWPVNVIKILSSSTKQYILSFLASLRVFLVFVRLCVSLRVFICLCLSLRVFAEFSRKTYN